MTAPKPQAVACAIIAHALFAYLGAKWVDINIVLVLVAICTWPLWWAVLGFGEMRTRVVWWSLAVGSIIYLPSVSVILLMASPGRG
ncbi:MAG: hypothetical protein ABSH26_11825 [Opitutaceae bacterium]|jgi:hypothetical protein